jgi:hypothetical protein
VEAFANDAPVKIVIIHLAKFEAMVVEGRVVNEVGEPIPQVNIIGHIKPDASMPVIQKMPFAISDRSGKFQLKDMPVGQNVTFINQVEGYEKDEINIPSPKKDTTKLKDIVLKKTAK